MGRSAIWGGATAGLLIGLVIGVIEGSVGRYAVYGVLIGAASGVAANILAAMAEALKARANHSRPYPAFEPLVSPETLAEMDDIRSRGAYFAEIWTPSSDMGEEEKFSAARYLAEQAREICGAADLDELERMDDAGRLPPAAAELVARAKQILGSA